MALFAKINVICVILIFTTQNIQTIRYTSQKIWTRIATSTNPNSLQKYSLKALKTIHKKEQIIRFPLVENFYKNTKIVTHHDTVTAFLLAQQKMKLPCVIPLFKKYFFYDEASAQYHPPIASVIILKKFQKLPPTLQCSTLLHELRHAQQHLSGIEMNAYENNNIEKIKRMEHDADRFAAHAMPCFVCCYLNQQAAFQQPHTLGYFCKSDYEPYVQRALQKNQRCKAHQNISPSELVHFDLNIDFDCGPLCHRIPDHIPTLPFFSKPPKI